MWDEQRRRIILCLSLLFLTIVGPASAGNAPPAATGKSVELTALEQRWLDANPVIKVGIDNAWPPLEFVDKAGTYRGMAAEYLALIEQRLGIRFEIEKQAPWPGVVKAVEAGELDAFSLVAETPQRLKFLEFTRTYLSFPYVIVTLEDAGFVDGLEGLRNRKVAVVNGYAIHDILKRNHPDLDLHLVETVDAGLEAVIVGEAYALVGNLAVISHIIRNGGITNLKVAGQTPYRSNLAMAFRKDMAPVVPIINKALLSLTAAETDRIYDRWIRIQFDRRLDTTTLLQVIGGSLGVILIIFMWSRRLQKEIRQRKSAEARIQEALSEAESANRSKSEFLASMSHEIRTPMNGVLGMASNLLTSDLTPKQRIQAQSIKESGDALLTLLNEILDLSKIEAGHVELEMLDFDLRKLIASVDTVWRPQMSARGLDFSVEISSDVPSVLISDPTRIRQILFNLVSNAAKFTETGTVTITITTQHLHENRLKLRFAVADTGIGIAPDVLPKIFSLFGQADKSVTRKFGGSGLGLAISKQLSELLGGEIGVDSTPGKGSTFWFAVSCSVGDRSALDALYQAEQTETPETGDPAQSRRILVAEDNHINQQVIQMMLEHGGHVVDCVANGIEAVSAVLRARYDLVLMDIQMPEMDGVTATKRIRALPGDVADIPIIALTANAMKGDRERYLEAGMTGYVPKPVDITNLFATIAKYSTPVPADSEVTPIATTAPVVDEHLLQRFEAVIGRTKVNDIINAVAADFAEFQDATSQSVQLEDRDKISRRAHVFSSTFGQLGAIRAQTRANLLAAATAGDDVRHLNDCILAFIDTGREALDKLTQPARFSTEAPATASRLKETSSTGL